MYPDVAPRFQFWLLTPQSLHRGLHGHPAVRIDKWRKKIRSTGQGTAAETAVDHLLGTWVRFPNLAFEAKTRLANELATLDFGSSFCATSDDLKDLHGFTPWFEGVGVILFWGSSFHQHCCGFLMSMLKPRAVPFAIFNSSRRQKRNAMATKIITFMKLGPSL